jgi:hypothetical protein
MTEINRYASAHATSEVEGGVLLFNATFFALIGIFYIVAASIHHDVSSLFIAAVMSHWCLPD